ncbi:histidinol-phosphatase [Methylobacterium nodulans]|uniref:Histidinol-phosphatase n=1 Tax=Methylobacterium nodulans (strain LMG 21967 / CNCM I-2342 / ORS 2060) TaxID=460265 RepID=B8IR14_METNO|nr:histidinol-phosphatase [Methylobacterium nodulans]ACL56716.1 histidinol-phosphate phosphatase [Methylobacterium nodulans ORS 2060]
MSVVDFARFVDELATQSGQAILPFFRAAFITEDKAVGAKPFDPVTEADRAGEAVMRQLISRTFPSHGILGEEFGTEGEGAEYVWVLDPIDGTRGFIAGLPLWGTLIGLTRGGTPCYGLMHQPFLGERFSGDGQTAQYRGPHGTRRLLTRRRSSLSEAIAATTDPRLFGEGREREAYGRVEAATRLTRFGTDCYAYCMLAAGQIDLVIEAGLKPYDIVALIPIVEGAGGVVTTWDGGPASGGGNIVAAGSKRLHEAALKLLNG